MNRRNQALIRAADMATDGLLVFVSYFIAVTLRFRVMRGQMSVAYLSPVFIAAAAGMSASVVVLLYALRLYRPDRLRSRRGDTVLVFGVIGVCALAFAACLYVVREMNFSRLTLAMLWLCAGLLVTLKHDMLIRLLGLMRSRGFNQTHVIVVGNGHLAAQFMQDVKAQPHVGFAVDGYVSAVEKEGLGRCLGSYEELDRILLDECIDELIVALEPHEIGHMPAVMRSADKAGVRMSLIPFFNDYIPAQPSVGTIGRTHLIDMRAMPLDHLGYAMIKRGMDIVLSLALIVLTAPLMIAIAVGVRMSSPGPAIFSQERVGRDKKRFRMLKFRSMCVNDAQDTGWSTARDARLTRFGRMIRRYSLDELPQFFNVLRGEMSLVGPRPEMPYHVEHFREEIPLYLLRQQVRPGITGWAQVNGLRGDTSIEERVKHDLWYIENWSLRLDVRILLRTIFGGMVNGEARDTEDEKQQ